MGKGPRHSFRIPYDSDFLHEIIQSALDVRHTFIALTYAKTCRRVARGEITNVLRTSSKWVLSGTL